MPNKNPRISMVVEPELYEIIHHLARKKGVSSSSITRDLVIEAIESREDIALMEIMENRLKDSDKEDYLSHDEAWN